eukprot:14856831-Alexandrium_andersonii.AAC.1
MQKGQPGLVEGEVDEVLCATSAHARSLRAGLADAEDQKVAVVVVRGARATHTHTCCTRQPGL